MANLDSTNKRRSATGIFHLFTIPWNPDGGDSEENRMHATYLYAGIAPGDATVIVTPASRVFTADYEPRTLSILDESRTYTIDYEPRTTVIL